VDTGALVGAIKNRHAIELVYGGADSKTPRLVYPHVLYRTRNGDLRVEGFQLSGPSSGPLPAWRQFQLMRIQSVAVLSARFELEPDFDPAKYGYGIIAMAGP
jgi:hypothetical protein